MAGHDRARLADRWLAGHLPAGALGILSIEFMVHAWDYAQATSQQVTVSDGLTAYVLDVASTIITSEVRGRGGFADPIEPGADAHVLDRLVAFTAAPHSPGSHPI